MARVVCDQSAPQCHCVSGDENIELSDRGPSFCQEASDPAELGGGALVEGRNLDCRRENIDQTMQLSRPFPIGAEAELGESDGAQAKLRRPLRLDPVRHITVSTQGVADAVGVEQVPHAWSSGFLFFAIAFCAGRGMSSFHAPRQARNSSDHPSAGSKMTFLPTRRAITSSCPSSKRQDFGKRTAWLPPF